MSSDDNKSNPNVNRFTDGPNYTRMVDGSQRESVNGRPEQWIESLPSRYQVQGLIGQGGMGQVYLATDVGETGQGSRQVAIKLVLGDLAGSQHAYERFVQEMHVAEQFEHETIVQVLTHGRTSQGVPYLVMQYVEGGSLLDKIRKTPGQRLPVDEVINIGLQVCTALMVAHDSGVIHRDIKPGNILVRQERYPRPRILVKLTDFGLARSLETSHHSMSAMAGTFGYRSPEQRLGGLVDVRSDLYSLGATLFYACSGDSPEGVIDFDDVPEVLHSVLRKAMSKRVSDRYASASEMYDALLICRSVGLRGDSILVKSSETEDFEDENRTKKPTLLDELTNSLGMKFRLIKPGDFMMGSPTNNTSNFHTTTSLEVTLTQPYYLGIYTVTQDEYLAITGRNPSDFKAKRHPVESVSWMDANAFISNLNEHKEEKNLNRAYRLPTEAEWEYACRAGNSSWYCFGSDDTQLHEYAWYSKNSQNRIHPVGEKKPNEWGFHDMHGNVWEWCQDWYGPYPNSPVTNPLGLSKGSSRILRGGSRIDVAEECRSGFRSWEAPTTRFSNLGFRLVLNIDNTTDHNAK